MFDPGWRIMYYCGLKNNTMYAGFGKFLKQAHVPADASLYRVFFMSAG